MILIRNDKNVKSVRVMVYPGVPVSRVNVEIIFIDGTGYNHNLRSDEFYSFSAECNDGKPLQFASGPDLTQMPIVYDRNPEQK